MQFNLGQLLWASINIFLVIFIVYILYNAYMNFKKKAENQQIQKEIIIKHLKEVVEVNKKIVEILSEENKPKIK